MKLIVGLGNPGSEYAKTRHNAGFMAVDQLATRYGLTNPKSKFHAGVLDGHIQGHRCVLLQPMTFMNRSGLAVGEATRFYKIDPEIDLLGSCRLAMERLADSPISKVVVTDTIPTQPRCKPLESKLVELSIAGLLGEAIYRIHHNQSISSLFRTNGKTNTHSKDKTTVKNP